MTRPSAAVRNRRHQLLARSALAGLGIAVVLGATPALASLDPGNVTGTASNGGSPVVTVNSPTQTTVTVNGSRTVIDWADFDIDNGNTANFVFDPAGNNWIVLNRVSGATSTINGILNGCLGTCTGSNYGGNVWIYNSNGVIFGANAQVNVGGLLATTGSVNRALDSSPGGFLDGNSYNFSFTGAAAGSAIDVQSGAQLTTHRGSLALIAPIVTTAAGSTLTGTNGGDVVYGSAENYNVTFAPTGTDDLDLISFQVPSQANGSAGTPGLTLNGTTNANQVFAAVVSKASVASSILLGGSITATSASGENGDIVLIAGAGFTNGVASTPLGFDGDITQNTTSTLTADNVTMRAGHDIVVDEINATGRVWLNSEWTSISQTGAITANILSAEAGGDVILTNTGNDFNFLTYIEAQGINGIDIVDADGFVIDSYIYHLGGGTRTASLTALTGSISATSSGVIQVGTLNVSAVGGSIDLGAAANNSTNLGTITAGAGDFNYRSLLDVNVAGVVTASNVTLISLAGQITQSGAGSILSGQLQAFASSGISLNSALNDVGTILRLSSGSGDIVYAQTNGFQITGALTATNGGMSLTSTNGSITQTTSGIITTSLLNANAGDDLILDQANVVGAVGNLTAGSGAGDDLVFNSTLDYAINGTVGGDDVTLTSGGSISQGASSRVIANLLTLDAVGGIDLPNGGFGTGNDIDALGLVTAGGAVSIASISALDLTADIDTNGANLTLYSQLGITQSGGVLRVGTLYAQSRADGITLNQANEVAALGHIFAEGSGNFTFRNAGNVVVNGMVEVLGDDLSLTSDTGSVVVNGIGMRAATLSVSAQTGINLNRANSIGTVEALTTAAGDITFLNSGSFDLAGAVSADNVTLTSTSGAITQSAGTITADVLTASAASGIDLDQVNAVATLGSLTAGATGDVTFTNSGDLELTGDITSGSGGVAAITSTGGAIDQSAGAITADWLKLNAATTITQDSGATFTSTALSLTSVGNVSLGEANSFTSLYDLAVGGDLTLRNSGSIDMGPVLSGFYNAAGALTLTSDTGSIFTTGAGVVTSRLTASAAGSITLDGTIGSLGDVTAGGNILLNNYSTALDLSGDVTGQTVSLYAGGGVAQSGGKIDASRINVITNGAISLTGANEIDVVGRLSTDPSFSGTGADITLNNVGNIVLDYLVEAAGATVTLTSVTGAISQTSFSTITADTLTASAAGNITIYDGVNNVATIGGLTSTSGGIVYRDVDSFDIQGNITANSAITRGLMLVAGAGSTITQTSGILDVGYFRGIAQSGITLGGANLIRRLISSQVSNGALTLNTTTDLSVDGTVAANAVSLTTTGAITQAANAQLWTTTLNASAANGINLAASGFGANNITNLGVISNTTSGGIVVTNATPTNLTGNITAAGQAVSISNTLGGINQTGGVITAGSLSLSAAGAISATRNNAFGSLGAVTAGGNVAITNVGDLYLSDNIDAGANTVSLTSSTGQIEQTVGGITANSLNLLAGGRIWLNNANAVTSLGTVTAGGHILFRNAGNTVVGGDITANGFEVALWSNAGSITQTAGSDITANSLQVIAQTGVTLTNAGNAINQLAWVDVASGGFAFRQTGGFQIVGPVLGVGQIVSLTSLTGAITQTSGSVLQAGTLNASAVGTLTLNQANNVTSLGVITTGGSFLFRDVDGFDLTGNVTATNQVVMLAQSGSITQTGGIITAADINAMATVDLLLGGANQIGAISALSAGNDLLYRQVGDLAVPTISAAGTVSLYSTTGDITQTGTITADTLVLGAGNNIVLGQNFVSKLGQIDAGGDFDASNAGGLSSGALALTDDITVGGAMTLVNPGAITQAASTTITAGSLFIDTDGALTATGGNSVTGATRLTVDGDVTWNSDGDLNLRVTTPGAATITSTGAILLDGGGASSVGGLFSLSAVTGISQAQTLTVSDFGNLTNTTSGGINLTTASWVELEGNVTAAGQTVALNVTTGGIIQNAGVITANRFSSTTTQGAFLNGMNNVAQLGVIDAGAHNFTFRTVGDLLIDGDISSALTMNLTSATGGISQTAGSDITAAGLTVWAETGINLTNAGNDVDRLMTVINLGSGGIAYSQTDGFQIDSTIRALNQTVSLTSIAGGISETGTAFAQIEAGTLNVSAGGAITLHRNNDVDNLGVVSAAGGFTFNDVDGFNITGNVTGGAVVLDAQNGSIVQTGGVISAASIDAAASGNLDLGSANVVAAVTALSAGGDILYRQVGDLSAPAITATGSLSLYSTTGSITQTGVLSAATFNAGAATGIALNDASNAFGALGNLANTTSGGITVYEVDGFNLTGAISTSAAQSVTLAVASGAITQQTGATVETGSLSLSATAGATLDGENDVDALGTISVGPFSFNDVDGFDIAGDIYAATANLTSGGAITQSTGVLGVGTLSLTAASVTLNGVNNIDNLGDVDVTGNMTFRDIDWIGLTGTIVVDGTLNLISNTDEIGQLSGSLDVGRFEATARHEIILQSAGNLIDALGDITSTNSNISIITSGANTLDGDLSAGGYAAVRSITGDVTMTTGGSITAGGDVLLRAQAGSIVLGAIDAGGLLSATAIGGSISSTAAPTIIANSFNAYATQDIVLTGTNIDIDQFGLVVAVGELSIVGNNGALDLTSNVFGATVALGSTGGITQSGGIISANSANISGGAGSLTLGLANDIDTVSLNGSSVSYTNAGSFAANVITATGAVSLTSNTGRITQTASTGRIVADSLTASAATGLEFFGGQNDIRLLAGLGSTSGGVTWRDMGGFQITGNINATGQTVELVSDGTGADGTDVTQSGGVITANRLQGTSAGDLLFTSANVVGQLGYLNAGGNIRYRGAASYTLQDNVYAGGGVILNADTGSIQQFGGVIVADAFAGTAAAGISLSRANDVDFLGAVDSGAGDFNFRDLDSFDIAGLITSDNGILLEAGGNITQSSGSIVTGTLRLAVSGAAVVNGSGNDIDFLGESTGMNALAFTDVDGFGISDRVFSSGAISLTATTGDIAEVAGGYLSANGLNVYASSGDIDLAGDNSIENVGDLMAGGDVTFHETDGFLTFGNIAGDAVRLTTAAGGISQINGAIGANSLYASALTGLNLTAIGNDVDVITGLVNLTSGGISYHNADSVSITGAVTAIGQTVNFDVNGNLSQTVTGVISAGRVQGAAMGVFALADAANVVAELGPISATSIDLVTVDTGLTIVGALYATNGVTLKADDFITQAASGTITANTLRALADGDIILDQANDLNSITLLYSDLGDITYADVDGFSLDGSSLGDFWTNGTFTLTAGGTGDIEQSGVGLRATTLVVSAGGNITLDEANRVTNLGAMTAGGYIYHYDFDDIALTDDINAGGSFNIVSINGGVTQTGGLITATTISGQSDGDFTLNNFDARLNSAISATGDVDISNTGDLIIDNLVQVGAGNSVTLTSDGSISSNAAGRIEAGSLTLNAGTYINLNSAARNDVDTLAGVTAGLSFYFIDDDSFQISGDIDIDGGAPGTTATLRSGGGAITQTGGAIKVDGLLVDAATGVDLSGANLVGALEITNGSGDVYFTNAQTLGVVGATSAGGVEIETTTGRLDVLGQIDAGSIVLTGANGAYASDLLSAAGDVTVTAVTGNALAARITSGDDVLVQATVGSAQIQNVTLYSDVDPEANGQTVRIIAAGNAFLGATSELGIVSHSLNRISGSGTVSVTSTGGDANVFLSSMNAPVTTLSAGGDNATARVVLQNGDLSLGSVTGDNVSLTAHGGNVSATQVTVGGGDYDLTGADFSSAAITISGTARDRTITDTAGDLELFTNVFAQRALTIIAQGSVLNGTGSVNIAAGLGGQGGDLNITAASIAAYFVRGDGNVILTALSGGIDIGTVLVAGDYSLTGDGFSGGTLSPLGGKAGTWSLTALGGLDFTGRTLSYRGDIDIQANDDITGGNVRSITGSVSIDGPSAIDIENLYAATDITVTTTGDLTLDSATSSGGDISLTGRDSLTVEGFLDAAGDVTATSNNGTADVNAATAGGNITVQTSSGDAILGAAALTGATGDLTILADGGGDVIFGVLDYTTVSTDNVFSRAAGSTGTATLLSSTGDVTANLWSSARLDLIEAGVDAEISTETGDLEIGQILSSGGEVAAEAVDGALTIGEVFAQNGFLGLYASGDLTILGRAYGYAGVEIETGGLLDSSLAIRISSGGGMDLTGGSVLLGQVRADGDLSIAAVGAGGDAYVEFAESGGYLIVGALDGAATLRAAEAADGIQLFALGNVTFGADSKALITSDNYATITSGGCGCGPGDITVVSQDGDVRVNLYSVDGVFDAIGAAIDGDVDVTLMTGNLTIADLAGFNVTVDVESGTLETGYGDPSLYGVFLSGGDYSITANGFLGNALTPNLPFGTLNDYTVVQRGGAALDMTGVQVVAQGDIQVTNASGNVLGDAQLTADGDVTVSASNITVDTIDAGGDVELDAGVSAINVTTSVIVDGDYTLTGATFSTAALNPLGAKAGDLSITDTGGNFDYTALSYAGDITINTEGGTTLGGAITSAGGSIAILGYSADVGALSAVSGRIDVDVTGGSANVASATALDDIRIVTSSGDAILGAATLLGVGSNSLLVDAAGYGDAVLGSYAASGITGANVFTSSGSTTTASVQAAGGRAFVHLATSDAITAVTAGSGNIGIAVTTGDFDLGSASSTGLIDIDGPDGRLTIGSLTADGNIDIHGADITLTNVDTTWNLFVTASGDLTFAGPDGVRSGRVAVDNWIVLEADDVTQDADAGLSALRLTVDATGDISLLGLNQVRTIGAVSGDSFAYRGVRLGGFDILGNIDVGGGTVELIAENGGITQGSGYSIFAGSLTGASQGGAEFAGYNSIDALGDFANTGGAFFLNATQALTIAGAVASDSAVVIQSQGGGMTIASTGSVSSTASGDAVVLASNGVFTNDSGADAVQAAGGRWLIYTQAQGDPNGSTAGDNYGGLGGKSYYGTAYDFATGDFGGPINAGNRFVHAYRPILTVTPNGGTVTYSGQIPSLTATILGLINGDLAADAWSGQAAINGVTSKNVGTYGLIASLGSLLSDMNYDFAFGTGVLTINPKTITGTVNASDKTYDATNLASGSISLNGVFAGDDVAATAASYSFADKNAGTDKTVTASGEALSGADAGNYVLSPLSTALADILRLTIGATVTADGKTYDGNASATGSIALNGVLAGDDLAIGGDLVFGDKNAGLGKAVTIANLAITGADAGNYNVDVAAAVADILRKTLTGTFTANDKTYDGGAAATGSLLVNGLLAGDDATVTGTYSFADKNAGVDKVVTATVTLTGADADNYVIDPVGTSLADILRKTVTISVTVADKTYDGTTGATGAMTVTGLIAGDAASVTNGTYSFADANAGTGKTVTIAGIALDGSDSGNYELTGVPSTLLADILRRQVAIRADDKVKLFGQLDPAFTFSITSGSLVGGDGFTGSLTREIGDTFGDYAITQGTVALSLNYELLFTPGMLSIRTVPGGGQDGGAAFRYLRSPKGVGLDWDPSANLSEGPSCLDECPSDEANAGGEGVDPQAKGQAVAMLGWRRFLPGAVGGKTSVD